MAEWGVVLFQSTNVAVKAERVTLEAGLNVRLIPAPRYLGPDCGVALRFPWEERTRVESVLTQSDVPFTRITEIE